MANTVKRLAAGRVWEILAAHAARVSYPPSDIRTQEIHWIATPAELLEQIASPHGLQLDCSQTIQLVAHVAGWKSPSGTYAIDGSTETILANRRLLHFTNPRDLGLMGLVVWLNGATDTYGHHVAQVKTPDPKHGNPVLWSHGSNPVSTVTLEQETAAQRGRPYVCISVNSL